MDMARFLRTLVRYSWLIVLFGAVAGGVAYLVSNEMPRQYASETRVLVGSLTEPDLQQQLGYQQLARTYASLATTPIVLSEAMAESGTQGSIDEVADRVSAVAGTDESIIHISVTAPSPADAQRLAEAIAAKVVRLSTPATPVNAPSLAQVIQPAVEDARPTAPRVMFDAAIAAAVGIALGVLVALLLSTRSEAARPAPRPTGAQPLGYPAGPGPYPR